MVALFRSGWNLVNREYYMEEALDIALSMGYCLTRIYLARFVKLQEYREYI